MGWGQENDVSDHIWAFQRSQGKVIFCIDGRRYEMEGGSVAYNSDEVGSLEVWAGDTEGPS